MSDKKVESSWEKQEKLILEVLRDLKEESKEASKMRTVHREDSLTWQAETSERLQAIEIDLREHKEGVIQNRASMKIFNERLVKIEEPVKSRAYLWSLILKIGTLAGVIAAIVKLYSL